MKIRSHKLYTFLLDHGVLDKGEEAISEAKREYRKLYKRTWKKNAVVKKKELRPGFTPKDHHELTIKAREIGHTPTAYIQKLALQSIGQSSLIPHRDTLLKVLQLVGVSANLIHPHRFTSTFSQADEYLKEAEEILLAYLNI